MKRIYLPSRDDILSMCRDGLICHRQPPSVIYNPSTPHPFPPFRGAVVTSNCAVNIPILLRHRLYCVILLCERMVRPTNVSYVIASDNIRDLMWQLDALYRFHLVGGPTSLKLSYTMYTSGSVSTLYNTWSNSFCPSQSPVFIQCGRYLHS